MAAKFRDHHVIGGDLHIVDSRSPAARDFAGGRDQAVAELARPDESDVALSDHHTLVMGVAGKGEG
jgi:hypothetical protein